MSSTGFSIAANDPILFAVWAHAGATSTLYGDSEDGHHQNNTGTTLAAPATLAGREGEKQYGQLGHVSKPEKMT